MTTLAALHRLAAAWRDRLALKVACVTGSSGKTSTKEFTAAVLSVRYRVVKTEGNLNNHIGLPLSILSASITDDAAVWEIGMNHPGEIAPLARLARPDLAIITNIGVAHIEYMGSREAIAAEKGALAEAVGSSGSVILSAEDDFASQIANRTAARVVPTGLSSGAVTASNIEMSAEGCRFTVHAGTETVAARVSAPGEHMVRNALLAVAAGLEFGLQLEECAEGLAAARLTGGRLTRRILRGVTVLDDTYNANPDSMDAALDTLGALPVAGRRIAVLGRMGELGEHAAAGYQRIGRNAARISDALIAVGPETDRFRKRPALRGSRKSTQRRIPPRRPVCSDNSPSRATSSLSKGAAPRGWSASSKPSDALLPLRARRVGAKSGLRERLFQGAERFQLHHISCDLRRRHRLPHLDHLWKLDDPATDLPQVRPAHSHEGGSQQAF